MMRRKHSEIVDPEAIQKILSEARIGRLATMGADGFPYITPVNYVFHRGCIYFHCAPKGEKLDNIARSPKVCFQVDIPLAYLDSAFLTEDAPCRVHQFYHCVIIRGVARVVEEEALKVEALNALLDSHEPARKSSPVHADMPSTKACKVVEIAPQQISAKSDLAQNKSAEERLSIARYLKARGARNDEATIRAFGLDPDDL